MANPKKIKRVQEFEDFLKDKLNFALIFYGSTKHQELETLRRKLKEVKGKVKVIKNSFFEKAVNRLSNKDKFFRSFRLKLFPLKYNTALISFQNDPYDGVKKVYEFLKEHEDLYFKGGVIDSQIFTKEEITKIAKLPGKTELLGKIYSAIKSPMSRTVYSLRFNLLKVTLAIKQIAEKKKGGEVNG